MTEPDHPLDAIFRSQPPPDRPLVILAWAQTLDGSVSMADASPLAISGDASLHFTHQLRASCDGILVGIGAVLADDPQLSVRLVAGKQPRPLVLDTNLRFPTAARLLDHPRSPWLLTGPEENTARRNELAARGATILPQPVDESGRIALPAALHTLRSHGIRTLMVEGGPTVHTAFLRRRLADWLVITVNPQLLGGLPALHPLVDDANNVPLLAAWRVTHIGEDLLIWGQPTWEQAG